MIWREKESDLPFSDRCSRNPKTDTYELKQILWIPFFVQIYLERLIKLKQGEPRV